MTPVPQGKPCAGNPHARFEEGASAQAEPRRSALLHNMELRERLLAAIQKLEGLLAYAIARGEKDEEERIRTELEPPSFFFDFWVSGVT